FRLAARCRAPSIEAALEDPFGACHPFIEVADHIVYGVASPAARAAWCAARLAQYGSVPSNHQQVQSGIEMTARGQAMQYGGGVLLTPHVALVGFVVAAIRELGILLSSTGQRPLLQGAQAF